MVLVLLVDPTDSESGIHCGPVVKGIDTRQVCRYFVTAECVNLNELAYRKDSLDAFQVTITNTAGNAVLKTHYDHNDTTVITMIDHYEDFVIRT